MILSGFQPLTLLDYPGVIASILFTQGCPFRCVYCHNPELIPIQTEQTGILQEEQVLAELKKCSRLIEGVCVTGGEPTIHPDLPEFIRKLKRLGLLVKLDTNGVHPRMIEQLLKEKLIDFIAMDLKHTWNRYADIIGISQPQVIQNCQETFRLIQTSGIQHEFRTTVYSALHTEHDVYAIADQLEDGERYALQEVRYQKTLQPNLKQAPPLPLQQIAEELQIRRPKLQVEVRV